MRRRRVGEASELYDRSHQSLDFRRSSCFNILQHRCLVPAYFLSAGDSLFQSNSKGDAELVGDRLCLGHHRRRELAGRWILANIDERRTGERTDGIEGQVAPELEPDLRTNVVEH